MKSITIIRKTKFFTCRSLSIPMKIHQTTYFVSLETECMCFYKHRNHNIHYYFNIFSIVFCFPSFISKKSNVRLLVPSNATRQFSSDGFHLLRLGTNLLHHFFQFEFITFHYRLNQHFYQLKYDLLQLLKSIQQLASYDSLQQSICHRCAHIKNYLQLD